MIFETQFIKYFLIKKNDGRDNEIDHLKLTTSTMGHCDT